MKKIIQTLLIAAPLLAISFASMAHDPKLHKKKPERANCAALDNINKDKEKMEMTDPIMIAMKSKC